MGWQTHAVLWRDGKVLEGAARVVGNEKGLTAGLRVTVCGV